MTLNPFSYSLIKANSLSAWYASSTPYPTVYISYPFLLKSPTNGKVPVSANGLQNPNISIVAFSRALNPIEFISQANPVTNSPKTSNSTVALTSFL